MEENLKEAIDSFIMTLNGNDEEKRIEKAWEEKQKERNEFKNNSGFKRLLEILKRTIELVCAGEKIRIEPDSSKERISVYGKDLSIAIGKNGKNMEAIEYIINLIGKRKKLIDKRVTIDIKDYRKKNVEKIRKIAIEMAKKAVKEGRKIALRPMPSYERKVVHNLLSTMENVRTASKDEGKKRRIIIYPVINNS